METLSTWQKTRARHLTVIGNAAEEPLPMKLHITENSKTGASIDFPPHATCNPTKVCMGAAGKGQSAPCYALSGFMGYPAAVKCQARNQRLVDHLATAPYREVCRVADALYSDLPRGRDFLRWNGAGDLTPGAVRLVNCFTRRHPDVKLWVVSRKVAMVAGLKDRASLRVLLSLDHSTPAAVAVALREAAMRFKRGKARLSWTRVSASDAPAADAHVVFNSHAGGHFNDWAHPAACKSSLPDSTTGCADCGHCFN